MYQLAGNIEFLFTGAGSYPDRVRAASAAGLSAVEMWGTSGVDVPALADALRETSTSMTLLTAEPRTDFVLPWTTLDGFWTGLDRSVADAQALGCPRLVVASGLAFPGMTRAANVDKLTEVFTQVTQHVAGSGITLVLEAVNTRVDHPGVLTDRTAEAVEIARRVDSPHFRVLYDAYHSLTEAEDLATELSAASDVLGYVQLADFPGRGEPGSGSVDWVQALAAIEAAGYTGPLGLECRPTVESAQSLEHIRTLVARASGPSPVRAP